MILGLALASRQQRPVAEGDVKALADAEHRIQSEFARHDKMKKLAERIRWLRDITNNPTCAPRLLRAISSSASALDTVYEASCFASTTRAAPE